MAGHKVLKLRAAMVSNGKRCHYASIEPSNVSISNSSKRPTVTPISYSDARADRQGRGQTVRLHSPNNQKDGHDTYPRAE